MLKFILKTDDMEEDGEIVEEPTVIEIDSSSDSRKASIDNDKDRKKSKKNRRSRSRDRSRSNRFVKAKWYMLILFKYLISLTTLTTWSHIKTTG